MKEAIKFVALVYMTGRQTNVAPADAEAGVGPDLTTIEIGDVGYVLDNKLILTLAEFIREGRTTETVEEQPPDFTWDSIVLDDDDDDDDLPPLV